MTKEEATLRVKMAITSSMLSGRPVEISPPDSLMRYILWGAAFEGPYFDGKNWNATGREPFRWHLFWPHENDIFEAL